MCRIVTGSCRPFRRSAQLSYKFKDVGELDQLGNRRELFVGEFGREFVVAVTARDVCVHNLVCYSRIFTCTSF